MKPKRPAKSKALQPAAPRFDGLLCGLREFIAESRRQVLRAVDVVQVRTCWGVGRHIVEFEQGGAARAEYGAKLLPRLAEKLTEEFGRGFDASNLRYMRLFYIAFPNCDALRHELSWTHYYSVLEGNEQLFATRYKLVLPSEEELRRELIREQRALEARVKKTSL